MLVLNPISTRISVLTVSYLAIVSVVGSLVFTYFSFTANGCMHSPCFTVFREPLASLLKTSLMVTNDYKIQNTNFISITKDANESQKREGLVLFSSAE